MAFSPLADMTKRVPDVGRSSPRMYAVSGVGVHYQYDKNAHTEATNPAREVSANYWIDDDGTIRPNIDESRRAWTSGAPGYPAGALADHRNITVEVSCIGSNTDRISRAALAALSRLIGDIYRRYDLGPVKRGAGKGVGVHRDWVATACPGNYMMDRLPGIIGSAEQFRTTGGALTAPKPDPKPGKQTTAQVAAAVYAGHYGNEPQRSARLRDAGYDPAVIQAEVNRRYYGGGGSSTGGSGGATGNISALADAVMRGEYGNGDERKRRLGSNYAAVQAEVNRRLSGGSSSSGGGGGGRKSNAQIAREIVHGVNGRNPWGNDPQRSQKLRAAGYDPKAVQREVNKLV